MDMNGQNRPKMGGCPLYTIPAISKICIASYCSKPGDGKEENVNILKHEQAFLGGSVNINLKI